MKEAFAIVGVITIAVLLWRGVFQPVLARDAIQGVNADSKDEAINALESSLRTKDELIRQQEALISSYQGERVNIPSPVLNPEAKAISSSYYIKDNGFDQQDFGTGFFCYQYFGGKIINPANAPEPQQLPNQTPWIFSGNAGIAANNSGFYVRNATNGDIDGAKSSKGQAAFLQFKESSFSQEISLPPGIYSLVFDFEGRQDYAPANVIEVSIDKNVLFKGAPTDCSNFQHVATASISFTTAGDHLLLFRGIGGDSAYPTTFVDNICIQSASQATAKFDAFKEDLEASPKSGVGGSDLRVLKASQ